VGEWLREEFKISERFGDFMDEVRDKLGLQKKYDPNRDNVSNEEYMRRNNEKLAGTAWKQVAPGVYEKDGKQYKASELTEETNMLFKQRGLFGQPSTSTGSLETAKQPSDSKLTSDEYNLAQAISKGEGTTDEQARAKGYESGYDVPVYYGKYGKPPMRISEMNLSQLRAYQNSVLEAQRKAGVPDGEGSSAVGKYQITRTTLFGDKDSPGLDQELGLRLTDKFSPALQDRLFKHLIDKAGAKDLSTPAKRAAFQSNVAGRWASVADPTTDEGRYKGQKASVKNKDIQPLINNLAQNKGQTAPTTATPVSTSLGKTVDEQSKALQSFNNAPPNVTVVAPQQQTVVNNMPNPSPPRPVQKASTLATEPSFVRGAMGDIPHPTNLR
jgi:hypothetical protein